MGSASSLFSSRRLDPGGGPLRKALIRDRTPAANTACAVGIRFCLLGLRGSGGIVVIWMARQPKPPTWLRVAFACGSAVHYLPSPLGLLYPPTPWEYFFSYFFTVKNNIRLFILMIIMFEILPPNSYRNPSHFSITTCHPPTPSDLPPGVPGGCGAPPPVP